LRVLGRSMVLCSVTIVARSGLSGRRAAAKYRSVTAAYWIGPLSVAPSLTPGCVQKRKPPATEPCEVCLPPEDHAICDEAEVGTGARVRDDGRNSSMSPRPAA